MIQIDPKASIRPTSGAKSLLDYLKEKEIFRRAVDAYAFAAAYAVQEGLDFSSPDLTNRADLVDADALDPEVRLALASALMVEDAHLNSTRSPTSSDVLDAFVRAAEVGCRVLAEEWEGLSRTQVSTSVKRIYLKKAKEAPEYAINS